MSFSIAGKTAIITGAANGVGLAVARQFIAMGANVMMADRDEERLRAEVKDASDEEGNARIFPCDLREKLSQANLLSATIDAFDRVDILVNGSRQVMSTDPLDTEDDTIEQMLTQNLMSGLRLSQLVAKRMIKQAEDDEGDENKGSIVNLSSIAARRTRPGLMGYSIASAALDQMTRTMAIALAPERIRVNAVAFGSVMSSSLKHALKETDGLRDDIIEHTPLSRIASASEVADAVQFLCSPGAGFITGEIITVDGGRALLDPVETAAH